MRSLLGKRNLGGFILAAVAAGALSVPAVAAQDTSSQAKKPVHKHSSGSSAAHSTNSTTGKSTRSTSSKSSSRKKTKKVKGQAAPTPERINEIQEALAKKGVFSGTPSGQWDDATVDAMKKFQSANGLNPSGKLDALTLQKLGLGSETAGLAAPTPPPNSANRLRNLSSLPSEPSN
ncbi:MAG: peptidoglycan-binding domain-containing protein [Candidatus Acidiferrum sp.]